MEHSLRNAAVERHDAENDATSAAGRIPTAGTQRASPSSKNFRPGDSIISYLSPGARTTRSNQQQLRNNARWRAPVA